jgi:hypothetical protein
LSTRFVIISTTTTNTRTETIRTTRSLYLPIFTTSTIRTGGPPVTHSTTTYQTTFITRLPTVSFVSTVIIAVPSYTTRPVTTTFTTSALFILTVVTTFITSRTTVSRLITETLIHSRTVDVIPTVAITTGPFSFSSPITTTFIYTPLHGG